MWTGWLISYLLHYSDSHQFNSVAQLYPIFCDPWTVAHQASLSITSSQSLLKLTFIESVMTYNHLILCHPLLLLPSIFPSIRVFSKESVLHLRWPKYWSFSFSISSSNQNVYFLVRARRHKFTYVFVITNVISLQCFVFFFNKVFFENTKVLLNMKGNVWHKAMSLGQFRSQTSWAWFLFHHIPAM